MDSFSLLLTPVPEKSDLGQDISEELTTLLLPAPMVWDQVIGYIQYGNEMHS